MKKHIVLLRQSLFDIAILRYGNVSGVNYLITDNNLVGPTDRLYEGQELLIRDSAINQRSIIYLNDYDPIATISHEDVPEGIGFWRLEEYIIIQ